MNPKAKATKLQVTVSMITLLCLCVPLFLLTVYPDDTYVKLLFGSGRVFLFWLLVYVAARIYDLCVKRNHREV